MNKYSAKKIVVRVLFGLAVFALASFAFIGSASAAEPTAQTLSASEISEDSARLNGYLYTQGEDTTYWFEYGTSRSDLDQDTSERDVSDRDGRVTVSNTIQNGLDSDETYYFRLVAENSDGIDRGEILSFQTDDSSGNNGGSNSPTVSTLSVRLSGNSAAFSGSVDPQGASTQIWFRYGRTSGALSFTTEGSWVYGTRVQTFSQTALNLSPGTSYYYQAVAQNQDGIDFGETLYFSTSGSNDNGGGNTTPGTSQAPSVITNFASATGNNSATLRAQVNPNGNLSSVWFEYGRSTSLGSATTRDPAGSGTVSSEYSMSLNGLAAGTTYYYRAAAQNPAGANRGQILSFRTGGTAIVPVTPTVPTTPAAPTTPTNPTVLGATDTPTGAPGCFTVSPAISSPQLKANDDFTYSVTYRNNCGYALSNGSLQVTLPMATDFAGTNYPFLTRDGNVITYNLGVIATNFQSAVTVNGKVRSQVVNGDSLVFQANITFTDPRGVSQNASGFLSAMIVDSAAVTTSGTSTLSASAADALSGLFHSGWFWLVLFLILIALFVFWLATRRRDGEDDEEEVEVDMAHAQ